MLNRRIGWAALGLYLCLSAVPALAQPTSQQQSAIRSSCRSDYMANCSSVKPGGAEALHCLQQNVAKLSPACQTAINAVAPPAAPPQQTTSAPVATPAAAPPAALPAPAAPPPAAAATPASAPPPAASSTRAPPAPQRARATPAAAAPPAAAPPQVTPQQQAALRQSCQSDFMARCSGVQPGGADALRCLQRNAAQLSPNCQHAVSALGGGATAATPVTAAPAAPPAGLTAEQQSAIKFTCRRDFTANCRGVSPGGPEAFTCLQRNAAKLSPDCRTSLAAVGDGAPANADAAPAVATPAVQGGPAPSPFPLRRALRERMMKQ